MNDIVKVTTFQEDIAAIKDVTTKAFLVTGDILLNIQDDEKYKEAGYKSFAEAVECELGLKKSHAYRLMKASIAYHNLSPIGENLPTAETQIRPLIGLDDDQQVQVWQAASKDGVPTAKKVKECVNELYPTPKKAKVVVDKPIVDNSTNHKCNNCSILENEIVLLQTSNKELVDTMLEMEAELLQLKQKISPPQNAPKIKPSIISTKLPRERAFSFIKDKGNNNQVTFITTGNPDNIKMFNMVKQIRTKMLETTPPHMLPADIMEATEVV